MKPTRITLREVDKGIGVYRHNKQIKYYLIAQAISEAGEWWAGEWRKLTMFWLGISQPVSEMVH